MIEKRLNELRKLMRQKGVDYYYVPASDAHRNEYVPSCWQRRAWISGFTGSAGDALIGQDDAYLWTDGRYFLRAEQELPAGFFKLMKQQPGTLPIDRWIASQKKPLTVGFDPKLMTIQQHAQWEKTFNKKHRLIPIELNLIDAIWEDQPPLPNKKAFHLALEYTGEETHEKIQRLRKTLQAYAAEGMIVTRLDDIAWLLNIRGTDIDYNPLVIAYLIVDQTSITLFIDSNKVDSDLATYFKKQHINCAPYDAFDAAIRNLKGTILLDPNNSSWHIQNEFKTADCVFTPSPITSMKAIKNKTEQNGMRIAHQLDAIALIRFFHWLENNWQKGVTELDAAKQLENFRRENPECKELSFMTISGFAEHGAIIHYAPTPETDKRIDDRSIYLIDSGGQYFGGTTDVTRCIHLGRPTKEQKKHFTLVLKAHLALRHHQFESGTPGEMLDSIARSVLQEEGFDYAHGTGHGVGCYLCVHEGPQSISPRASGVGLQAGMMVSNEPGLYFPGEYGIRIENVCAIINILGTNKLQFDDLTLVPYALNLIDVNRLDEQEINWINEYHQTIWTHVSNAIEDTNTKNWLKKATNPIKRVG